MGVILPFNDPELLPSRVDEPCSDASRIFQPAPPLGMRWGGAIHSLSLASRLRSSSSRVLRLRNQNVEGGRRAPLVPGRLGATQPCRLGRRGSLGFSAALQAGLTGAAVSSQRGGPVSRMGIATRWLRRGWTARGALCRRHETRIGPQRNTIGLD